MRTRQVLGGVLALLLLGVASTPARAGEGPGIDQQTASPAADQDLELAIQRDLHDSELADFDAVQVDVVNGIVTLTGRVDSDYAREEAMRTARTYEGVEVVLDRMTMAQRPVRTDEQIEADIEQMMQKHSPFDFEQVKVEADHGTATLTGRTDSHRDRSLAGDLAASVDGVGRVENHVEVPQPAGTPARDDQQIRQEIQANLIRLFGPEASDVELDVDDGRVELEGTVPTVEVREDVIDIVWVPGVTEVDDEDLRIDLDGAQPAAGYGPAATSDVQHAAYTGDMDTDLQRSISQAFDEEPVLDRLEPAVRVDGGVVYLTGDVVSESARSRAEEIATAAPGVVRVDNKIMVRGESIEEYLSDDAIQRRVEADLFESPLLERNQVNVDVDEGVVRLTGRVWSTRERAAAEDIARGVTGVKDVKNDLAVSN